MENDDLMLLAAKWRSENGDYPEAKRDCAEELERALSQRTPQNGAVPEDIRVLADLATPGELHARVVERGGEVIDAFLTVPSIVQGESVAGPYPMEWLAEDSYRDGGPEQKAHDARFTAAAVNYVRALLAAAPAPEAAKCACGVSTCVEPWEPGCGLGNSEEFIVAAPEAERAKGAMERVVRDG